MTAARVHPFELMFGGFRAEHFAAIRVAMADRIDVNSFVLAAPALELLRELRPDEGLGEGVDDFVSLVHAAYLFWRDGERTVELEEHATRSLVLPGRRGGHPRSPGTEYVQIAPHIIWGQLDPASAFEPLDGWFVMPTSDATLRLVACFGVHAQRPGVSVAVVAGAQPAASLRSDGTALFAPVMPGGDAAHLHAATTADELLLLGWRAAYAEDT